MADQKGPIGYKIPKIKDEDLLKELNELSVTAEEEELENELADLMRDQLNVETHEGDLSPEDKEFQRLSALSEDELDEEIQELDGEELPHDYRQELSDALKNSQAQENDNKSEKTSFFSKIVDLFKKIVEKLENIAEKLGIIEKTENLVGPELAEEYKEINDRVSRIKEVGKEAHNKIDKEFKKATQDLNPSSKEFKEDKKIYSDAHKALDERIKAKIDPLKEEKRQLNKNNKEFIKDSKEFDKLLNTSDKAISDAHKSIEKTDNQLEKANEKAQNLATNLDKTNQEISNMIKSPENRSISDNATRELSEILSKLPDISSISDVEDISSKASNKPPATTPIAKDNNSARSR